MLSQFSTLFENEIRVVYRDYDIYNMILSLYDIFPQHDLALKEVTTILDHLI